MVLVTNPSSAIGRTSETKEDVVTLPREQSAAFGRFYKSARENKILEPKTTLLLHFASAMAVGCYP